MKYDEILTKRPETRHPNISKLQLLIKLLVFLTLLSAVDYSNTKSRAKTFVLVGSVIFVSAWRDMEGHGGGIGHFQT